MVTIVNGREAHARAVHRPGAQRHESASADWVPTTCRMCLAGCAVLVQVRDGKVVNVIGNPDSPKNQGRMCAKGKSGIINHYNPNRVTKPLKRTNPAKGIGIDPKWKEISWEEALETISGKLRKVCREDPRKLYLQIWGFNELHNWLGALGSAVGTPHVHSGVSPTCGKTIHSIQQVIAGGFHKDPDFSHCNYLIDCGTQMGVATREAFNRHVPDCANARERGMKLVVVDPVGNNAAAKANEWLPIRPGTDAAFGLGMLNVLLNELGMYDAGFLKHHTNAAYLVGSDGQFVRDAASRKPLLYDGGDAAAKTYDDPTLKDPALEGEYQVQGEKTKPAFELLKARAREYPAERVEEITSIPARTIRRIAREFGEAARIGATVTIDGVEVPYRPVNLEWMRGPQGHKHAWHHSWALTLVNLVVGAHGVVGSGHSTEVGQNWPVRSWPQAGADGMLQSSSAAHGPRRTVARPGRWDLAELFPAALHSRTLVPEVLKDPGKYGIDHKIELLIHTTGNYVMGGWGDTNAVLDWYKSVDMVVGFAVEIHETHELDDIVLPMPTYLEENTLRGSPGNPARIALAGDHVGFHHIQQAVLAPPEGVRNPVEVMMEICHRVGILDDVYAVMNRTLGLKPPHLLEAGKRYTEVEVIDRDAKSLYGEDKGWDWFKQNGVLVHERDVEERYPGRFIKARIPVYLEHFIGLRAELETVLAEMKLEWDLSDYQPMPEWKPCESYEQLRRGEIDAVGVHYKLPYTYGTHGNANAWINELCERLPQSYGVLINTRLARSKGIRDGDAVWLESPVKKVKTVARVTECVHPEVIGIAGNAGHWARGKPLSTGKGVNFNGLLRFDLSTLDVISSSLEHCIPLKLYKA